MPAIPRNTFLDLELDTPVNIYFAWTLVRKNFCPAMSQRGLCRRVETQNCNVCIKHLRAAFDIYGASNPVGLLIWKLREQAALIADEVQVNREVNRETAGGNPFEAILEELDD